MRRLALLLVLAGCLAPAAVADTVVLENGRDLEDVVVSRNDDEVVVVNPWNSRHPEMTWEIPDENVIPRTKVAEVVIADAPLVEARRRAMEAKGADDLVALARFCREHDLDDEAEHHLAEALAREPDHAEALEAFGGERAWERFLKRHPAFDATIREMEQAYLALVEPDDLAAQIDAMEDEGSKRELAYLERARRSAALPRGHREKVALTLRAAEAPGATYCIHVPRAYDPLRPTPLVIGLHGGGRGAADDTIVTGSGEQAMAFYREQAERWGWIVVCPTALAAPWGHRRNEPWIDALLEELRCLYNVDETRIYLTGHSMGGFGTWHWGPKRAETWAAIAPCAGGGGPNGVASKGLPVYIYHGSDDGIVGPDSDRNAARSLAGGRQPHDFVYTEIGGVGHGFPAWVRGDIFRFFAGRMKDGRRRATAPVSSFDRKPSREERDAFGDPRKLPEAGAEAADLKDLIDRLELGGGAAREAAARLGERKDERTARAVARVLRSRRSSEDVRIAACEALGAIGIEACVKPLARAVDDEDYRVVEAAVRALGQTGEAEAVEAVAEGLEALGLRFEDSIQGGRIPFRAYEVRLGSLATAAEAAARLGSTAGEEDVDAEELVDALEAQVAQRVFLREEPLAVLGEEDPRFRQNPPAARLALARALVDALGAWAPDARGAALLERVRDAWRDRQPALASTLDRALADRAR